MKVTALIPARLSSTRFDRKLLMDLCGKSIILRTYEAVVNTELFNSVYVVTEDQEIYNEIVNAGGNSILSKIDMNQEVIELLRHVNRLILMLLLIFKVMNLSSTHLALKN
jgi:CMP-2-keto-3-deoxyoctulosonic acid synthetase